MPGSDMDLSRLYLSNEAANPTEKLAIRARIRALGSQISALREQLRELEAEEQSYRALASLVRLLPLEILGDIFTLSVAMEDLEDPSDRDGATAVVNLGLVCKRWRDAALLEHRLWSSLSVCIAGDRPSLNKISSWLCRSGSSAKSLKFTARHDHMYDAMDSAAGKCDECVASLAKILTHGPLLDKLTLTMHLPECYDRLFTALGAHRSSSGRPWDHVGSLALTMQQGFGWGRTTPRFPDLPPVTSFELNLPEMEETFPNRVACEQSDLGLSPHFINRLTRLSIQINWTINHLVSVLELCTHLEELTVDFRTHPLTHPSVTPISQTVIDNGVLLPRVHKIRLEYTDVESLEILLLLHIPRLYELEVDFSTLGYGFDPLGQSQIDLYWIPFALRHPNLQAIRMSNGTIDPEASVRSMFTPFSALTQLIFDTINFDPDALFTSLPPNEKLFEELETLELLNVDAAGFAVENVFHFFGANLSPLFYPTSTDRPLHANLKRLAITFRQVVCEIDFSWASGKGNALSNKGVDVCIGPRYYARAPY